MRKEKIYNGIMAVVFDKRVGGKEDVEELIKEVDEAWARGKPLEHLVEDVKIHLKHIKEKYGLKETDLKIQIEVKTFSSTIRVAREAGIDPWKELEGRVR